MQPTVGAPGESTVVTVGMFYDVVEGRESDFEEKFDHVVAAMNDQPGHVNTTLYRQVRGPGSYAILSEWRSRDAFQSFVGSDTFREVTAWGRAGILAGRPRHRVFGGDGGRG